MAPTELSYEALCSILPTEWRPALGSWRELVPVWRPSRPQVTLPAVPTLRLWLPSRRQLRMVACAAVLGCAGYALYRGLRRTTLGDACLDWFWSVIDPIDARGRGGYNRLVHRVDVAARAQRERNVSQDATDLYLNNCRRELNEAYLALNSLNEAGRQDPATCAQCEASPDDRNTCQHRARWWEMQCPRAAVHMVLAARELFPPHLTPRSRANELAIHRVFVRVLDARNVRQHHRALLLTVATELMWEQTEAQLGLHMRMVSAYRNCEAAWRGRREQPRE
jgi:hypothetical protein